MATLSKSFTAAGNGTGLSIVPDDKMTYDVSGTFVGTVVLERTLDAGATWTTITSATGAASGTIHNQEAKTATYRFRCSAFTSGTIVTALADVAIVTEEFGNGVLGLADDGATVTGTLAVTSTITSGSVAVPTISSTSTLTNKTITAPVLGGTVTGTYTLAGTPTLTSPTINSPSIATPTVTGAGTFADLTGSGLALTKAGFAGSVALTIGEGSSNGFQIKQIDELVDLTALGATSVALTTPIPAGAVILSAQANVDELVVAGGTTVKVALGLAAGDVDKYGKTASLVLNQKINTLADWAVLSAQEDIAVCGVVTDGTTLGDSNITAGKVQVRIVYIELASMANA
jgi:hypothetical protein